MCAIDRIMCVFTIFNRLHFCENKLIYSMGQIIKLLMLFFHSDCPSVDTPTAQF